MNRTFFGLAIMVAAGCLLLAEPAAAQKSPHNPTGPFARKGPYAARPELPPAPAASRVRITKGPELESARYNLAIITWTSNNPGGTDEHYGVVHYGTDPKNLNLTAKSHIRLNRAHPETIFRVRVPDLKPGTTYYYTVDSTWGNGKSDGVKSPVKRFTMPADATSPRAAVR
jgi:Purple acid Phosphatase, N-terminal domain